MGRRDGSVDNRARICLRKLKNESWRILYFLYRMEFLIVKSAAIVGC
jgi:hypothetical protein